MVFAKNCAKGPKPSMPILRVDDWLQDEVDMVMLFQRKREQREAKELSVRALLK